MPWCVRECDAIVWSNSWPSPGIRDIGLNVGVWKRLRKSFGTVCLSEIKSEIFSVMKVSNFSPRVKEERDMVATIRSDTHSPPRPETFCSQYLQYLASL